MSNSLQINQKRLKTGGKDWLVLHRQGVAVTDLPECWYSVGIKPPVVT